MRGQMRCASGVVAAISGGPHHTCIQAARPLRPLVLRAAPMRIRSSVPLAALAALSACAPAAQGPAGTPAQPEGRYPARFEVVGRGPVTHTRTMDLAAFRGADGRDYVYTATATCQGCVGSRMYVWDVTDPAAPALTDSIAVDAELISALAVNEERTMAALGRRGARSLRNGVVLLDLRDPAHPAPAGEYWETLTGGVEGLAFDGTLLYVADAGAGDLAVLDIADPRDPRVVGRWGVPSREGRFLSDVQVQDGLAYLAYWDDGLIILDVGHGIKGGTPRRPRPVSQSRYTTQWRNQQYGNTHFVMVHTNGAGRRYAFVGDAILPRGADLGRPVDVGGILHVFDLRNVEAPVEVATYEVMDRGINKFWARGDTLYVATNNGGLRALDVSGELRGSLRRRELAVLATGDEQGFVKNLPFTWAAVPHNGLVFATDFNSGLWVARVVPAQP